jgi:predicted outer membrane repeat protein
VGRGTADSCTSSAVVAAVRAGGIIDFSCGPHPVTITMRATAKVLNTSALVVLDGGGLVTLSGEGRRRILYMDTCDQAQVWTTSHCEDQATPALVVQNLRFEDGNSIGADFDGGGGGAIFARGGRLRIVNTTFSDNRCERDGPDIGGGAVRALSQYNSLPVYVVDSRFTRNVCSNGGALSSIGVSWTVLNSRFIDNRAIGTGANPAQTGTPGGGSGGAIYNDGDAMTLSIGGSLFAGNRANEGGGAIFFVSDDRTGTMTIANSTLERNHNAGFQTAGLPGIFFLGAHSPTITDSILR